MATGTSPHDASYAPILSFAKWSAVANGEHQFVQTAHDRLQHLLDSNRAQGIKDLALAHALDGAALETGAIEGLYRSTSGITISVIDGSIALSAATAEISREADVDALISGQREAYDLALDLMAGTQPMSEAVVRRLHETVCRGQETYSVVTDVGVQEQHLETGVYKRHPNHVRLGDGSVHSYCPVLDVPAEMGRLVAEANSALFAQASAVLRAAYLHHSLTHIHPFADGNGRTARVVASIPLLQSHSVPFVVFADRDGEYRTTQSGADRGDTEPFVHFVERSVVDLLRLVATRLETDFKHQPDLTELATKIERRPERIAKEAAENLFFILLSVGRNVAAGLDLPTPFTASFGQPKLQTTTPPLGMERLGKAQQLTVRFSSDVSRNRMLSVYFDTSGEGTEVVQIVTADSTFEARLDELLPQPSLSLRSRLQAWLEGIAIDILQDLNADYC